MDRDGVKTQMNRGCRTGFAVLTQGDLLEDPVGAKVEEPVGVEAGAVHGHRVLQQANVVAVTHSGNLFQQTT